MAGDRPTAGVVVHQPARGFRYGSEAFWVVGFALERGVPTRVADLGTGSGVIAALFASLGCEAVGYDVRPEWEPLWERTQAESHLAGSLSLQIRDVAGGIDSGFDLVVSNPPYFRLGTGPIAADPFRAAARHEITATLADFVAAAGQSGASRAVYVLPAERAGELEQAGRAVGLPLARRLQIGRRLVLVELDRDWTASPETARIDESDARVVGWYQRLGARPSHA